MIKYIHQIHKVIKRYYKDIINGHSKEIKFMDGKNNEDYLYQIFFDIINNNLFILFIYQNIKMNNNIIRIYYIK